jgi:hypothetical protein
MRTGKISVITSLYRSEAHLPAYRARVLDVAGQVKAAGLALEVVLVANDPTDGERDHLRHLAWSVDGIGTVIPLEVPRENLYASWNRGIASSSGLCLAIWNVDDARYADALIEGYRLIADGCEIVDFPFTAVREIRWLGLFNMQHQRRLPPQYDPVNFRRKTRTGPFFMFSRAVYDRVGPFDGHFRIAGDFDWCARPAARAAKFCAGQSLAGTFFLRGTNLSGSGSPFEDVEDNIVLLRQGRWDELVPADPDLLEACWSEWGSLGAREISPDLQDRLWGAGACDRWQAWLRARRRKEIARRVRYLPRQIVNRSGLRPVLARLGVVKR